VQGSVSPQVPRTKGNGRAAQSNGRGRINQRILFEKEKGEKEVARARVHQKKGGGLAPSLEERKNCFGRPDAKKAAVGEASSADPPKLGGPAGRRPAAKSGGKAPFPASKERRGRQRAIR